VTILEEMLTLLRQSVLTEEALAATRGESPGDAISFLQWLPTQIPAGGARTEGDDTPHNLMAQDARRGFDPPTMPSVQITATNCTAANVHEEFSSPRSRNWKFLKSKRVSMPGKNSRKGSSIGSFSIHSPS